MLIARVYPKSQCRLYRNLCRLFNEQLIPETLLKKTIPKERIKRKILDYSLPLTQPLIIHLMLLAIIQMCFAASSIAIFWGFADRYSEKYRGTYGFQFMVALGMFGFIWCVYAFGRALELCRLL